MYTGHHWLYLNIAEQDLNSFAPAWAAYRGILATPSMILPPNIRATHLGLTPHIIRLTRKRNAISLEKELALEVIRRKKYPNAVSRLNCIYCWPDAGAAQLAARLWIPQGKHFSEKYLVEIDVSAPRAPTIVDTRWIDRFVILSNEPLEALGTQWIYEYWRGAHYPWKGEADISREPHMECLVDGIALISGTELRMEALSVVEKLAPDSLAILEKGRLGVDLSTRPDGSEEWRFGSARSGPIEGYGQFSLGSKFNMHG